MSIVFKNLNIFFIVIIFLFSSFLKASSNESQDFEIEEGDSKEISLNEYENEQRREYNNDQRRDVERFVKGQKISISYYGDWRLATVRKSFIRGGIVFVEVRFKDGFFSKTLAYPVGKGLVHEVGTKVEKNSSECAICLETIKLDSLFKKHEIFKSCGHVFHKKCVKALNKSWNSKKCPVCRSVR